MIHSETPVLRHRTAISRVDFSRPVKALLAHGMLPSGTSFLDYGCGLGDDVRFLQALQVKASGWDPVYFPNVPLIESDVVNLGYVLNVIESIEEREQTISKAFTLAKKILCISVLVGSFDNEGISRPFGDGVVTSRNTFQKYFAQEELAALIEKVLSLQAFPVAPGIFFVFRHRADQNSFVLSRLRRQGIPTARSIVGRTREVVQSSLLHAFRTQHTAIWNDLLIFLRENGRPPESTESPVLHTAKRFGIDANELIRAATKEVGEDIVEIICNMRRTELIVFLAISCFRRVPKMMELPPNIRNAIRFHFASHDNALATAKDHLFAVGRQAELGAVCFRQTVGVNTKDGYFVLRSMLYMLPALLQIYARLGELFYGDLGSVDLIKIHKTSAKLTLFLLEDMEKERRPALATRVKIDLQAQTVRLFDHVHQDEREYLVGLSLLQNSHNLHSDEPESRLGATLLSYGLPFGLIARERIIKDTERKIGLAPRNTLP